MLVLTLCLLTLATTGRTADPCVVAQLIDEPRRSTNYTVAHPNYDDLYCDNTLKFGWYKFNGGSKLATTCQPFYHCNTHVPVWMHGSHPTTLGQIVTAEVCAPITESGGCAQNDCFWKDTIRVVMCQNFYAYELKPVPGCHLAYCAGDGTPCQVHQTSPTGFTPGCVDKYPLMLTDPHLSNPILTGNSPNGKPTSFKFQCTVNFDPARHDVGFDVTFLFDGKPDPKVQSVPISGAVRTVDLDQSQLTGHMGQNVSCAVRSYFTAPSSHFKSPFIPSNGYWVGIKVEQDRLVVGEKDKPRTLTMYSTVPVVCPPPHDVTCHLDIDLDPINNNNEINFVKECRVTFTPDMWNSTTNRAETTFKVSATRDGKVDKDKEIYLHFKPIFTGDASPFFNNYQVPFVQIIANNSNIATCSCTGDPHCATLDTDLTKQGSVLDYYLIGEFVMYKSTKRDFEVQVRTWSCNTVTCNCAVAMKEGNDVVILDMCHTQYGTSYPRLTIPGKGSMSHGTIISQDKSGNNYLVSFPSGAQVRVSNNGGVALDVFITSAEDDYIGTEGICGYFDGKQDNDLKHSNGKVSNIPTGRFQDNEFVNSWRIKPVGSSFFDKQTFVPDPSLDHDMYFCKCDNKSKQVDCTLDGNVAKPNIKALLPGATTQQQIQNGHLTANQIINGRRRRAAKSILPDDYPTDYVYDYGLTFVPVLKADFPSVHGKTRADAEAACNAAIDQNPTLQQCVRRAGLDFAPEKDICVEDFKYFDDGEFVRSHMLNAIAKCVNHVLRNESFYDANGNLPAFVWSDLCPSYDCNKHGTCTNGRCVCDPGFVGDACEIQATKPPVLYGIIKTTWIAGSVLCDVTERECETAYVHGKNVFDNPRLSCKVEVLKFDGHSFVPTGSQFTTAAIYRSMYDVGCKLPVKSTIEGQTVVAFNISVTNDASTYSNEVTFVRTDGQCARCAKTGETCSVKTGTCLIEGNCRTAGETNPANRHQICDPARSATQWTSPVTQAPHTTESPHTVTTPPTAGLGGTYLSRFDIWTFSQNGCQCAHNPTDYSCACCDAGGCQCQAPHQNQCTQCGKPANCGRPQPAPESGVDGFTNVFDDCPCQYDTNKRNCACCKDDVNACQCGKEHRNQCVDCNHMEQCGNKPWIFGPLMAAP